MKSKIRYRKNYSFKHRQIQRKKYPWNYLTNEEFSKVVIKDYQNSLNRVKNFFNSRLYVNEDLLTMSKHVFTAISDSIPKKHLLLVKDTLVELTLKFLKDMELSPEKEKENSLIILMNSFNKKE